MNKRLILLLLIFLFAYVGYGQVIIYDTVTIHTTLLKVNGIVKGQLIKDATLLPAFNYKFVVTETMDLTTIPIDSLQFQNSQLQNQVNQLSVQLNLLISEFSTLENKLKTQPILCE